MKNRRKQYDKKERKHLALSKEQKRKISYLTIGSIIALSIGFWIYQGSIQSAVTSATSSFMSQLADHDAKNIENQISNGITNLHTFINRIQRKREPSQDEIIYMMGIESQSSKFKKLYLVSEDEKVYDNNYLVSHLDDYGWKEAYKSNSEDFVTKIFKDNRERWEEYILYGCHLETPVMFGKEKIRSIVGLVPIEEIASTISIKSFDGQGSAIVIQRDGSIITSSKYYDSNDDQNFFTKLKKADEIHGISYDECVRSIHGGKEVMLSYTLDGNTYHTLLKPLTLSDWYVAVEVSENVTKSQTLQLVRTSLLFFLLFGFILAIMFVSIFRNMKRAQVAEASEQAKSTFLANMSHEIRTPLNGIVGLHYLMRKHINDPDKLSEYLDKSDASTEFLKSVITDVLDMSKIESGQMELYPHPFSLLKLIENVRELIDIQAQQRHLSFVCRTSDIRYSYVCGDNVRIEQILINLLGNALKFTPSNGLVELLVTQETVSDNKVHTTFMIKDTGIGMSEAFLKKMWEPFEQEYRMASQNGTGLGTTLSKILVEKMGGTITVSSKINQGTTFTVTLPLPIEELPEEERKTETVLLEGRKILVAEDNNINLNILQDILEEQGCIVDTASDGKEAVDTFAKSELHAYDIILMDLQMPNMNGYEAAETIRKMNRSDAKTVSIFALTANAFREDIDHALNSGMDDVLTKPLKIDLLLKKLAKEES